MLRCGVQRPSRELEPFLPGYGYKMTDTVTLFNDRGPDIHQIWQR